MRSNFSLFKETQWCWCFFILFYVVPSIPALPVRATTATLSPGHGENALSFWSCTSPALPWVLLQNLSSSLSPLFSPCCHFCPQWVLFFSSAPCSSGGRWSHSLQGHRRNPHPHLSSFHLRKGGRSRLSSSCPATFNPGEPQAAPLSPSPASSISPHINS